MPGGLHLYISDNKAYRIPSPKDWVFKAVPELAGCGVLRVSMIYETKLRKPWRLQAISYDRIQLDEKGQYIMTNEDIKKSMYNFNNFAYMTEEELSKRDEPVAIPVAPVIPSDNEKRILNEYIKSTYPELWQNSPEAIEQSIYIRKEQYNRLVSLVKKANKLRKSNPAQGY